MTVSAPKTAEQIELPVGLLTQVGPRNHHVLDAGTLWSQLAYTIERPKAAAMISIFFRVSRF